MRFATLLGLVALVATACGKKDDAPAPSEQKKPAAAPAKQTFAEVIAASSKPGLLGPFAAGKFGMTKQELEAAVPVFADKGDYLSDKDFGVSFFVSLDGEPKRLEQERVTVPDADLASIDKAWGPGKELTYRRKPSKVWLAAGDKVRAILTEGMDPGEHTLIIAPYFPAKEILGEPGKPLGLETGKPFLGSTPDELESGYPEAFDRALDTLAFMTWLPDEYGDAFKMELRLDDGKVDELQFWLHHGGNEELKAETLAALEAKYGASKKVKTTLGQEKLQLGDSPKVIVGETDGAWVIEVSEK